MRVVLVPDLELEGWKSMELYAHQLERWLPRLAPDWAFEVVRLPTPRWGRARPLRFAARYVLLPRRVARARRKEPAALHHILDHSYAHVLRWLDPRRTIITVHDLYPYHLVSVGGTGARIRLRNAVLQWVLTSLREAAHVIADSEFTKREMVHGLGYPEERITVVPLGGDHIGAPSEGEEALERTVRQLDLPPGARFVLHVGSCDARKNIGTALRAFSRLRELTGEDLYFVQVGGRFARAHWRAIHQWGIARYVRQRADLPWEQLASVYRAAALLLFPSTYEGFGLPVLEAMRMGTPVVALAAGAVPEVLGDAGLLVLENEAEAFAMAAARVLEDGTLRDTLVKRARERARAFTWEETARRALAVYRAVASLDPR
ncbi:D-inositol 3-phosphate glycosyltransferase [bacterium HR08]|nr:D-inositol 3-phosphate glycosyltransferase [bacterium HR08]